MTVTTQGGKGAGQAGLGWLAHAARLGRRHRLVVQRARGGALLAVFMVVPFILAFYFSFTNERLISPRPTEWVGLRNYTRIFEDELFWKALGNNVAFSLVVVPLQTAFALFLAVVVTRAFAARRSSAPSSSCR